MPHDTLSEDREQSCDLPCGFKLLQGQYQIERPLISGGFGITYLARDSLDRRVVIKECFPAGLCRRDGADVAPCTLAQAKPYRSMLRAFLREAHWLARSQHPGIAGVHQVFKENQTAYIAMEFIDGLDLLTVREEQPERLTGAVLRQILDQALEALQCIHGLGILHRDISPDNFLIGKANKLTLIDFGAACGTAPDDDTALLAVKDGYSALELYKPDLPQRLACDLYALGATMRYLITGEPPAHSLQRLHAVMAGDPDPCPPLAGGAWAADSALLASVDKAMSVLPADRFQTADAWTKALAAGAAGQQPVAPAVPPEPAADPEEPEGAGKLDIVIADLVARTNGSLTPGQPRSAKQDQPLPPPKPAAANRPLVNIFGEPVTDLEAWLQEEDAIVRRRKNAPAAEQPPAAGAAEAGREQDRDQGRDKDRGRHQQSFAGRLRKIFGRKQGSLETVRN